MHEASHYHDVYGIRSYWKMAISGYGVESGEAQYAWHWWNDATRSWERQYGVRTTNFVRIEK